jgi:hypothetical protein
VTGVLIATAVFLLSATVAGRADAQHASGPVRAEARLEALLASDNALHAGGGVVVRVARTADLALLGGAAVAREGGAPRARAEVVARFHLDPERRGWGWYASGGVAALQGAERDWEGLLVFMIGVELGRHRRWSPFVEGGYGGGARLAAGMRGG